MLDAFSFRGFPQCPYKKPSDSCPLGGRSDLPPAPPALESEGEEKTCCVPHTPHSECQLGWDGRPRVCLGHLSASFLGVDEFLSSFGMVVVGVGESVFSLTLHETPMRAFKENRQSQDCTQVTQLGFSPRSGDSTVLFASVLREHLCGHTVLPPIPPPPRAEQGAPAAQFKGPPSPVLSCR